MDGVFVLNSTVEYTVDVLQVGVWAFIFAIILTFSVYLIFCSLHESNLFFTIFGIMSLLIGVISCSNKIHKAEIADEHFVYEVTISDDVKFNEFDEKYEIIDKRGKIYVVRDRVE